MSVTLVCASCDKVFERKYASNVSRYVSGTGTPRNFCSRACVYKRSRKGTSRNNNWVSDRAGSHSDARNNVSKFVKRRYENRCVICGEGNCDVHHIIPIHKGGSNALGNLVLLCPNCHRLAHRDIINPARLQHARKNMVIRLDVPREVRDALLAEK